MRLLLDRGGLRLRGGRGGLASARAAANGARLLIERGVERAPERAPPAVVQQAHWGESCQKVLRETSARRLRSSCARVDRGSSGSSEGECENENRRVL